MSEANKKTAGNTSSLAMYIHHSFSYFIYAEELSFNTGFTEKNAYRPS